MPQERTYGALSLAEIKERIASRTMLSWASLDDMAADIARLRAELEQLRKQLNDQTEGR